MSTGLPVLQILAVIVLGAASWFVYVSIAEQRLNHRIRSRMRQVVSPDRFVVSDLDDAQPMFERALVRVLSRFGEYEQAVSLVRGAGFFSSHAAYRFSLIRIGLAFAAPIATLFLAPALDAQWQGAAVSAAGLGYLAPKMVLSRIGKKRRILLLRETPVFLDLVLLLLRSGVSIEQSLRQIWQLGGSSIPEIHRTVGTLLTDLDQGRDYQDALDRWAARMVITPGTDIARMFQQSLTQGIELSEALAGYAGRMIEDRMVDARALAGRRVTQTTVVMLIFLLPPLLILVAAPGFTSVVQAIGKF